jgi:hypothetical protein
MPMYSPTDPVLVTLAQAKAQIHVADTAFDAEITDMMTAASATIRDYLKERNDPTWTPDTVPPWIRQSVLLLLGNWYEHRGDAQANDADVWAAIVTLCRRSSDAALA